MAFFWVLSCHKYQQLRAINFGKLNLQVIYAFALKCSRIVCTQWMNFAWPPAASLTCVQYLRWNKPKSESLTDGRDESFITLKSISCFLSVIESLALNRKKANKSNEAGCQTCWTEPFTASQSPNPAELLDWVDCLCLSSWSDCERWLWLSAHRCCFTVTVSHFTI